MYTAFYAGNEENSSIHTTGEIIIQNIKKMGKFNVIFDNRKTRSSVTRYYANIEQIKKVQYFKYT